MGIAKLCGFEPFEHPMANRRRHPRILTFMRGKLNIPGKDSPMGCAILNASDRGACILVPDAAAAPCTFALMIDLTG